MAAPSPAHRLMPLPLSYVDESCCDWFNPQSNQRVYMELWKVDLLWHVWQYLNGTMRVVQGNHDLTSLLFELDGPASDGICVAFQAINSPCFPQVVMEGPPLRDTATYKVYMELSLPGVARLQHLLGRVVKPVQATQWSIDQTCPDCKGEKVYRGLFEVEPCRRCDGSGRCVP